mmetsp:Transcript_5091/g.17105  ORF Transcript_5091/g.17105 Transcript_5091/m.17105 type:complete len:761 (+) Transcript_5091:81-2363(+)
MARDLKSSGNAAKARRQARRSAKFNPKPAAAALINVGDKGQYDDEYAANEGENGGKGSGKKLGKRKKTAGGADRADAKFSGAKKTKAGANGGDKKNKHDVEKPREKVDFSQLNRKEAKAKSDELKALRKPNFALVQELAVMWERMRGKKVSKNDRRELCDAIYAKCVGKVPELANNHKGSRVVQAVMKYGTPEQCDGIMSEVKPQMSLLSKSLYGNFLVRKLIDGTNKNDLPALIECVKGQISRLARHPIGSQILEALYHPAAAKEKRGMVFEFYGPEYVHFRASDDVKTLREALLLKPVAQRQGMLQHINMSMIPVLEKGLVSSSIIHRVLAEYLDVGGPSSKAEAAGSIAAAGLLRMMHTKDGATAVNLMLSYAGAKQRKGVIKALKGQVWRVAQDDYAHCVITTLFDCVDDTQLLSKGIISELKQEGLEEVIMHKNARRIILHLLNPRCTRYFPPHLLECVPDPAKVKQDAEDAVEALKRGGRAEKEAKKASGKVSDSDDEDNDADESDDDDDDDMGVVDDEFNGDANDDDDDDDDDDLEEAPADGPDFGVAKKPANVRRSELFKQGLGKSLIATCSVNAASMLRSNLASDVIFEVAAGGNDAVFAEAVGDETMVELYEAIAEAVLKSMSSEKVDEESVEPLEPLHTNFFSSRTLRRMALEIKHPSFVPTFWNGAVKDNLKTWVDGHGAKVVAAFVRADTDAKTRKSINGAVGKLVDGNDVEAWSEKFFRAAPESKAPAKAKTSTKAKTPAKSKTKK